MWHHVVWPRPLPQPVLLTFHHLMTRPRGVALTAGGAAADLGGAIRWEGVAETVVGGVTRDRDVVGGVVGGAEEGEETDAASPQLEDDSTERADGLTLDSPGHAHPHNYHGNEAGLELGLWGPAPCRQPSITSEVILSFVCVYFLFSHSATVWTAINSTGYTHCNELLIFTELITWTIMWEKSCMLLKHQVMSSASDVWTQTIILTIWVFNV